LVLLLGQVGFPKEMPTLHSVRQRHIGFLQLTVVLIMVRNKTQQGLVGFPGKIEVVVKVHRQLHPVIILKMSIQQFQKTIKCRFLFSF
jgi:hypothetical protein